MPYARLDEVLSCLINCSAIIKRTPLRNGGVWGRLVLVGGISGIVTFPNRYLKNGSVDAEDLKSLPAGLRYRLVFVQWLLILSLGGMVICFVLIKIVKT